MFRMFYNNFIKRTPSEGNVLREFIQNGVKPDAAATLLIESKKVKFAHNVQHSNGVTASSSVSFTSDTPPEVIAQLTRVTIEAAEQSAKRVSKSVQTDNTQGSGSSEGKIGGDIVDQLGNKAKSLNDVGKAGEMAAKAASGVTSILKDF